MQRLVRWALIGVALASFVLVPFALFGPRLEGEMQTALEAAASDRAVAAWVVALLTLDVLLPVPSSGVAMIGAHRLGAPIAFGAVWLGLTCGSALGLGLGRALGRNGLSSWVGPEETRRARRLFESVPGDMVLAATRGVPVLNEACLLLVGASAGTLARPWVVCAMANGAIAGCFVAAGRLSAADPSGVLVLAGTVGLPVVFVGALACVAWAVGRSRVAGPE